MQRLMMVGACVSLMGCGAHPTESEMRNCAEEYIRLIEAYHVENGEFPERIAELEDAYGSQFEKLELDYAFPVDYQRRVRFDPERRTSYVLTVGQIIADRRELSYDSATEEWHFDS